MQLQQARSQLAKEKSKREEDVLQLTQSQLSLEEKVETMERLATQATARVKELEASVHQSKQEARRWARDEAVEIAKRETLAYVQDIDLLRRQLQEARSQLRASAAASLQQFDTASETLSPDWRGGNVGGGDLGSGSSPPVLDLMTPAGRRTPHPKRRAPPPPPR